MAKTPEHPDPDKHWKHRRNGFYFGRRWAIAQTVAWVGLAIYNAELLNALSVVIGSSYGLSFVLIAGYYGNTAVETYASRGAR